MKKFSVFILVFFLFISVLFGQNINMQNGITTVVDTATPLTFYDSGGNSGNYQANDYRVHTFCPSDSDHYLRVRFFNYDIANQNAFLTIFDGTNTQAPPIVTLSYTYASTYQIFTSSQPGGCLTLRFTSNASAPLAGWYATFDCIPKAGINGPMWTQVRDYNQNRVVGGCTVTTCAGTYTDEGGGGGLYERASGCRARFLSQRSV